MNTMLSIGRSCSALARILVFNRCILPSVKGCPLPPFAWLPVLDADRADVVNIMLSICRSCSALARTLVFNGYLWYLALLYNNHTTTIQQLYNNLYNNYTTTAISLVFRYAWQAKGDFPFRFK